MMMDFRKDNGNTNPNLRNIIRQGYVSAVYPDRNTVRVTFPDEDNLVSGELQILTSYAGGTKLFTMPDVNEMVVVAMSGNDDSAGTGYVLGSVFTAKTPPNANTIDETKINFADGTVISYNRKTHRLEIDSAGDIVITAKGNLKLNAERIDLNE